MSVVRSQLVPGSFGSFKFLLRRHCPMDLAVSSTKGAYTCVNLAPSKHQMRLYVCHQMRLPSPQRSSLRSLTFARFARTFRMD